MLWFWRYLIGYVTIKIDGENCEKVLNNATANNIKIWNLTYKNGCILGCVSLKNFYKLRIIKRKVKCKIKILNKSGFIFYINKHNNRIGFLFGIVLFFCTLTFLSNFIWIINVEGNEFLPENQILSECKKIGIYEGIYKGKIKNKYDSQKLQLANDKIAWCSLNVEGCVLTVNISEVNDFDKSDREMPSNLKATIDGKVKKINISSGNALVKVGDTVAKGDLLVSGILQNMTSTQFIHSKGEIIAETKRVFSAEGSFKQTVLSETGEVYKRYTINFFELKLPLYLGTKKGDYNYHKKISTLKLFEKQLPIKIACEEYKKTYKKEIVHDEKSLEKILYNKIQSQVKKFNFISVTETNRQIIKTDKGILLNIDYVCEENIATTEKILLDLQN